jgi:hypothetical protein
LGNAGWERSRDSLCHKHLGTGGAFEFIQRDTTSGNNQDPFSLHKYLYANADPINNNDPSGHDDDNELEDEAFDEADEDVAEDVGGYTAVDQALGISIYQSYAEAWQTIAVDVFTGVAGGALAGASESFVAADEGLESAESGDLEELAEGESDIAGEFGEGGEGGSGCFLAGTEVLLGNGAEEDIQDIQVGQRVATDGGVANSPTGSKAADPNATEVDPATWRLVTMQLDEGSIDGREDIVQIQALEPLSEIVQEGAKVGGYIPVALDLQEMGLPNLPAQVTSITACPPIATGSGRVVLATVTHLNDEVFDLTLTNGQGGSEVIGVTAYHLIYTQDRGWVEISQLQIGEFVQGAYGYLKVTGLTQRPGDFQVYNLDVETDHVYYVGVDPALVHNMCAVAAAGDEGDYSAADELIQNELEEAATTADINNTIFRLALQGAAAAETSIEDAEFLLDIAVQAAQDAAEAQELIQALLLIAGQ